MANETKYEFWPYNNDNINIERYGLLYPYESTKEVCPEGWHLPNREDWTTLIYSLGGIDIAGNKLMTKSGWNNPKEGASNSSAFSVIPSGYRTSENVFSSRGNSSFFWLQTLDNGNPNNTLNADCILFSNSSNEGVSFAAAPKTFGFSVRCLKTEKVNLPQNFIFDIGNTGNSKLLIMDYNNFLSLMNLRRVNRTDIIDSVMQSNGFKKETKIYRTYSIDNDEFKISIGFLSIDFDNFSIPDVVIAVFKKSNSAYKQFLKILGDRIQFDATKEQSVSS